MGDQSVHQPLRRRVSTTIVEPDTGAAAVDRALRAELLRLADLEDAAANEQAARVPYWSPTPSAVVGRRAAARILRLDADRFLPRLA
jgi:hypothetical protein